MVTAALLTYLTVATFMVLALWVKRRDRPSRWYSVLDVLLLPLLWPLVAACSVLGWVLGFTGREGE